VESLSKVKLSSKFQVVFPREIREKLNLKLGEQMATIEETGVVLLVPQKSIKQIRGFVKGEYTQNIRDEDYRF
jgi:AbrB family looped-hinge helix DNA binding protein